MDHCINITICVDNDAFGITYDEQLLSSLAFSGTLQSGSKPIPPTSILTVALASA
jgi:hypothetical protein